MKTKHLLSLLVLMGSASMVIGQNIGINETGAIPNATAILDVSAADKGVLIPRTDTATVNAAGTPATGLLVYQSSDNTFYYFNGTKWIPFITSETLVSATDTLPLIIDADRDTYVHTEENTDEDLIRFRLGGTEHFRMNDARLEVLNSGKSIFIGENAGASSSYIADFENIAIGYNASSKLTTAWGNIAIGSEANNGGSTTSENIAIGPYTLSSSTIGYNIAIGAYAGNRITTGGYNLLIGNQTGYGLTTGANNTAVGNAALYLNVTGTANTALGTNSAYQNNGSYNTMIGAAAGLNNFTGSGNVFLGFAAGYDESGSDKLYIQNSYSPNPLIWGDFADDSVKIYGTLGVRDVYVFPNVDGSSGQFMTTDGTGNLSWANAAGDNLGDHTATENVQMNGYWLTNDGGDEGLFVDAQGNVGVAGDPDARFHVVVDGTDTTLMAASTTGSGAAGGAVGSKWQSFTMTTSGTVTEIALKYVNVGGATRTVTLYEGEGTSGASLASSSKTINGGGWYSYYFSGVDLVGGQMYTISTNGAEWVFDNSGSYANGQSSVDPARDYTFKVYAVSEFSGFRVSSAGTTIADYTMPTSDGNSGQVMMTNGAGNVAWADLTFIDTDDQTLSLSNDTLYIDGGNSVDLSGYNTADNLGNHTATQFLNMSGNYIGGDNTGGEGLFMGTAGNIGINNDLSTLSAASSANSADGLIEIVLKGQTSGNLCGINAQGSGTGTMDMLTSDASGNLAKRMVFRGSSNNSDIEFYRGSSGSETMYVEFAGSENGVLIGSSYAGAITAPANGLLVQGNVGIGTTTASELLDVAGTATIDELNINSVYTLPTADGTSGQVLSTDGAGNVTWSTASGSSTYIVDADGDTKIQVEESADEDIIRFDTKGTEYFTMEKGRLGVVNTNSNVVIGDQAGVTLSSTGRHNTYVGTSAGYLNISGSYNAAYGKEALYANGSADENNSFGYRSLMLSSTGQRNCAFGSHAMLESTTGSYNTAMGNDALYYNRGGTYNTAIGYKAMYGNATSGQNNYCTALGYQALNTTNLSNAMALGYNADATANNQVRVGNSSVTSIGGYANWTNLSDGRFKTNVKEDIVGLDFIMKLRPVSYNINVDALQKFQGRADSTRDFESDALKEAEIQTGFIAQEVERAAKEVNFNFHGVDVPQNEESHYGLRYAEFVVPIVKSIQEQQNVIQQQQQIIETQEITIDELKQLIQQQQQQIDAIMVKIKDN